jgi:hypothetical protein
MRQSSNQPSLQRNDSRASTGSAMPMPGLIGELTGELGAGNDLSGVLLPRNLLLDFDDQFSSGRGDKYQDYNGEKETSDNQSGEDGADSDAPPPPRRNNRPGPMTPALRQYVAEVLADPAEGNAGRDDEHQRRNGEETTSGSESGDGDSDSKSDEGEEKTPGSQSRDGDSDSKSHEGEVNISGHPTQQVQVSTSGQSGLKPPSCPLPMLPLDNGMVDDNDEESSDAQHTNGTSKPVNPDGQPQGNITALALSAPHEPGNPGSNPPGYISLGSDPSDSAQGEEGEGALRQPAPCLRAKKVFSVAGPFTASALVAVFLYLNAEMLIAKEAGNQTSDVTKDSNWVAHFFLIFAGLLSMKAIFSISDRRHAFSQGDGTCKDGVVIACDSLLILTFISAASLQNVLSFGWLDSAPEGLKNVSEAAIIPGIATGASSNLLTYLLLLKRDWFSSGLNGALTVFKGLDALLFFAFAAHSALGSYDPDYAKETIIQQEVALAIIAALLLANLGTGILASLLVCEKPKQASCCARLCGFQRAGEGSEGLLDVVAESVDENGVVGSKGCCP